MKKLYSIAKNGYGQKSRCTRQENPHLTPVACDQVPGAGRRDFTRLRTIGLNEEFASVSNIPARPPNETHTSAKVQKRKQKTITLIQARSLLLF